MTDIKALVEMEPTIRGLLESHDVPPLKTAIREVLGATLAAITALRPLADGSRVNSVARAIADAILEQDMCDPVRLDWDNRLPWLDQGETDFTKVAQAAIRAMIAAKD